MTERLLKNSDENGNNSWADAMTDTPAFEEEKTTEEIKVPINYNEDGPIYATPEICREDNELLLKECQNSLNIFNKTGRWLYDLDEYGEFKKVIIPGDTAQRIMNISILLDSLTAIGKERQNKLADYGVFTRDLYAICNTYYSFNTGSHFNEIFEAAEQHFKGDKTEEYKKNMGSLITKSRWLERSDGDDDGFYEHFPGYTDDELNCLATVIATEADFNSDNIDSKKLGWDGKSEYDNQADYPYDPIIVQIFNRLDDNGEEDYSEKVLSLAREIADNNSQ